MNGLEPIPISLVAHTVFCPRRAWLEAAGEAVVNANIESGLAAHTVADKASQGQDTVRSLTVQHADLGLTGKCDVVHIDEFGELELVEFKATPGKRRAEVSLANKVQLALQRLCLEAQGHMVTRQRVYFTNHRRSVEVDLSPTDFAEARGFVHQTREIILDRVAPPPLLASEKCRSCSHIGICLPDERQQRPVRRVLASDPEGEVLHLTVPGSRAFLRAGRIVVERRHEALGNLPVDRVHGLVVHGNVDISTALHRELLWRGCTVVWCSGRGRVVGFSRPAKGPNGMVRAQQLHSSVSGDLTLARELIASKISNQATQLRRNGHEVPAEVIKQIRSLGREASQGRDVRALFGVEGRAAAIYFGEFTAMLRNCPWASERWRGREGRGATDPVNVALNFVYGLLLAETLRAVIACGLDPHLGFVHSSNRNKPALALDLMEQFRPVVADSVVMTVLNTGELRETDFSHALGDSRLRERGRRTLTVAFERRITQSFKHPVFHYQCTWRRALEIQARLLLGYLDGTQDSYLGIRSR